MFCSSAMPSWLTLSVLFDCRILLSWIFSIKYDCIISAPEMSNHILTKSWLPVTLQSLFCMFSHHAPRLLYNFYNLSVILFYSPHFSMAFVVFCFFFCVFRCVFLCFWCFSLFFSPISVDIWPFLLYAIFYREALHLVQGCIYGMPQLVSKGR